MTLSTITHSHNARFWVRIPTENDVSAVMDESGLKNGPEWPRAFVSLGAELRDVLSPLLSPRGSSRANHSIQSICAYLILIFLAIFSVDLM